MSTNNNIFSFLVKSNLIKLEPSRYVILPPTVRVLWLMRLKEFWLRHSMSSDCCSRRPRFESHPSQDFASINIFKWCKTRLKNSDFGALFHNEKSFLICNNLSWTCTTYLLNILLSSINSLRENQWIFLKSLISGQEPMSKTNFRVSCAALKSCTWLVVSN